MRKKREEGETRECRNAKEDQINIMNTDSLFYVLN